MHSYYNQWCLQLLAAGCDLHATLLQLFVKSLLNVVSQFVKYSSLS